MTLTGSFALPWDELTEQQQTCRVDRVLDEASDYAYVAARDNYRAGDADPESPDWCPAEAVERRRRYLDKHRRNA